MFSLNLHIERIFTSLAPMPSPQVVVDTTDTGMRLVAELNKQRSGRVTFMPLDALRAPDVSAQGGTPAPAMYNPGSVWALVKAWTRWECVFWQASTLSHIKCFQVLDIAPTLTN